MAWIANIVRGAILLMVGGAIVLLWTYCTMMLPSALVHAGFGGAAASAGAGLLTLLILTAAPALPIQILFPRHAVTAALAIGWMPLACAVLMAVPADHGLVAEPALFRASAIGCAHWMAVAGGAWCAASLRRPRQTPADHLGVASPK